MPLLMSTTFAPMENGDYLLVHARTTAQNLKEIARHSKHDADAYDQYATTSRWSARPSSRCSTWSRPTSSATTPRSSSRSRRSARASASSTSASLHNAVRLLTGSAADFLDDYFESRHRSRATSPRRASSGPRSGRARRAPGLVLLYHYDRRARRRVRGVGVPQGGNGGFTQVLARAAQSFGAEIVLESPVERVITKDGRATGVALTDGTEYYADTVVSARSTRGARSSSSSTRASCRTTSSRTSSASGSRAPRRR